jgi:hypothetical protein
MRPLSRTRPLLVAILVVLVCSAVPAGVAAVPDARLTVSGLTVSPDAPVVDEPVTTTVTVTNSGGSAEPVEIDRVLVRTTDGETLTRADEPGALSQGGSLTVDLVTGFEDPGRTDLEAVVVGTDADGDTTRAVRPFTVVTERAPPSLDADLRRPVAEVETPVQVTVTNPSTTPRRNLRLTVAGEGGSVDDTTVPALAAGGAVTVNLSTRLPEGASTVAVNLSYTTSTGARASTERELSVVAEPPVADAGVSVRPAPEVDQEAAADGLGGLLGSVGGGGAAPGGGSLRSTDDGGDRPTAVVVEVTNFGNTRLASVVVTPRVDDRTLPRRAVGVLAPGESRTVSVDLSGVPGGDLEAVVDYRVATTDRTGRAAGSLAYDPPAGEVRLTDVDLSFRDGRLVVTGNAGNVGDGGVTGLVVAVGENEAVRPSYPQRTYFVGTVEGSEFAPFELTADVDATNATEIPVTVSYRTGGERLTRNVSVPYDPSLTPEDRQNGDALATGLPFSGLGLAVGAGVGVAVLGPTTYLLRRR